MTQPIWNTNNIIGTYPANVSISIQLSATPVSPATTLTYAKISGTFPTGLTLSNNGVLSGTPATVIQDTQTTFTVRVTDNLGNIRDRTFTMTISGEAGPKLSTPSGNILTEDDSVWIELPILYTNPIPTNDVILRVSQGQLPPGLEMNSSGLIRGYAQAPIASVNYSEINTQTIVISDNEITCLTTEGFAVGRPVEFSGTPIGGIDVTKTYFIQSVTAEQNTFTISETVDGPVVTLTDAVGTMDITLPEVSIGQPIIQTYSFTVRIDSQLGSDSKPYTITIVNQNAPEREFGPLPSESRIPTILNTRPDTYDIEDSNDFGYYVLPPDGNGTTYLPTENAPLGTFTSDNEFYFRILGKDFDGNSLRYNFADLPLGLVGNTDTGWITGNLQISSDIGQFSFSVSVEKEDDPSIISPFFRFSFILSNNIDGTITWNTSEDLGKIENSSESLLSVNAVSEFSLQYRLVDGELPPNLQLSSDGDIIGTVAFQPDNQIKQVGEETEFSFTIEAFSPLYPVVSSLRTFTLSVIQEYQQPTDTLYIKCTPDINDRQMIKKLLNDEQLIPQEMIYRPDDINYGKAKDITYAHAYGIDANNIDEYIEAITKNHYWKRVTLGEIKTAVAKDDSGNIIYEVVYSTVIDNLVNPEGKSISKQIFWPTTINLNKGPWYTSITDLYTSYIQGNGQLYYSSLEPGDVRTLYPNSLTNMREQVGEQLGQEFNFRLYPKWMTSQQSNGSTLGFTPAWVICYTKPGFSEYIKNKIENDWKKDSDNPESEIAKLNEINFRIDRFLVDKFKTYNYDPSTETWSSLPSATPPPDPRDSEDFYVLFPRKTILPDEFE